MDEIFEFDDIPLNDEKAEIDNEIINEEIENMNLELVSKFKEIISKEPEFTGINQVSDYQILQEFLNPDKSVKLKHFKLSGFQLELFEDLFYKINRLYDSDEVYDKIGKKIYDLLYV
jgi:hypothetical protein